LLRRQGNKQTRLVETGGRSLRFDLETVVHARDDLLPASDDLTKLQTLPRLLVVLRDSPFAEILHVRVRHVLYFRPLSRSGSSGPAGGCCRGSDGRGGGEQHHGSAPATGGSRIL